MGSEAARASICSVPDEGDVLRAGPPAVISKSAADICDAFIYEPAETQCGGTVSTPAISLPCASSPSSCVRERVRERASSRWSLGCPQRVQASRTAAPSMVLCSHASNAVFVRVRARARTIRRPTCSKIFSFLSLDAVKRS